MAHEITSTDTTLTFTGTKGKAAGAWHGLDTPFSSHYDCMEEALKDAKLDWQAVTQPLFTKINHANDKGEINVVEMEVPERRVVLRSDNAHILGTVGPDWHPLQNIEAFNWFQPFLDEGLAKLETCGSLQGGRIIWVLAQVCNQEGEINAGDQYENRILLSNAHNDKLSVRVGFTPVRVVCKNTIRAAHSCAASKLIRIRHSKNVKENVVKVREVMDVANNEFRATLDELKALTRKDINRADLRKYVKTVVGKFSQKSDKDIAEFIEDDSKMSTRMRGVVEKAIGIIETQPGAEYGKGTWYQAAQGMNFFANYIQGNKPEVRLENIWFKDMASLPFEIAYQMAG